MVFQSIYKYSQEETKTKNQIKKGSKHCQFHSSGLELESRLSVAIAKELVLVVLNSDLTVSGIDDPIDALDLRRVLDAAKDLPAALDLKNKINK